MKQKSQLFWNVKFKKLIKNDSNTRFVQIITVITMLILSMMLHDQTQ